MDFVRSRKAQISKSSESRLGPSQQEVSLNKSPSHNTASELDYTTQAQETPGTTIEDDQEEENENLPVVQPPITGDLFISFNFISDVHIKTHTHKNKDLHVLCFC